MLKVKKANEIIIPSVTPSGLLWLGLVPAIEDDKMIGKSGHIHGARIVTSPEIKAKPSSNTILNKPIITNFQFPISNNK